MSSSTLELRELLHLPEALVKALGEVTARAEQIEHLLQLTVSRTTDLSYEEAVAAVTRNFRLENRKRAKRGFRDWAVKQHGNVEGTRRADEFDKLLDDWAQLANQRDDVTHCAWSVGPDGQVTGTRKGCLLTTGDDRPFSVHDVQALAHKLAIVLVEVNKATRPEFISGPKESMERLPELYATGRALPTTMVASATCASSTMIFARAVKPKS